MKAGISFNSTPPQPLFNGKTGGGYSSASISDAAGNLQFYYATSFSSSFNNPDSIYNRNHQAMPNGHGFNSQANNNNLIIPWPGQQKYYLFAGIIEIFSSRFINKNGYSVIDITLNNGLGDVTSVKNVALNDSSFYAMAAVKHRNNRDYWVIYQKNPVGAFYSYLISPAGLDTVPVISNVQINPPSYGILMKASPDGKTLAFSYRHLNNFGFQDSITFLNFSPASGIVTKAFSLGSNGSVRSMEFSPDGSKFYCSRHGYAVPGIPGNLQALIQYDLEAGSPLAIQNSETKIFDYTWYAHIGSMQAAPDGKIYHINSFTLQPSTSSGKYLHVIQRPNLKGKACRYTIDAIDLDPSNSGLRSATHRLPTFVQSYFYRPKVVMQQTCFGDTSKFELGNRAYVDSVNWNFGDPASGTGNTSRSFTPKHFYAGAGSYQVRAIVHFNYASDTVNQTIYIPATIVKPNLGNDTTLCQGSTLQLKAYQPGATYEWQDSLTTDSVFTVTRAGRYFVQVSNGCGVFSDTINVRFDPALPPVFSLGADTLLCPGQQLVLNVNASKILWSDSIAGPAFTVSKPGTYWAEIQNSCGSRRDSITVSYRQPLPPKWLPRDTTICDRQAYQLNGTMAGALSYRWQNGSTNPTFTASASGTYWLEITTACTTLRDSVKLTFNPVSIRFKADTTICTGDGFVLKATPGLNYRWHDGNSNQSRIVSQAGIYKVTVETVPGCFFTDSIQVKETRCFRTPFIVNIVTPNNDNLNDRFEPKGLEAGTWELTIYNRWGNLIYKSANYKDQWPDPAISNGTYYYLLRNNSGKTHKGWVEIVR